MFHKYVLLFARVATWIDKHYPPYLITFKITDAGIIPPTPEHVSLGRQLIGDVLRLGMILVFIGPLAAVPLIEISLPFGTGVDMGLVIGTLMLLFGLIIHEFVQYIHSR